MTIKVCSVSVLEDNPFKKNAIGVLFTALSIAVLFLTCDGQRRTFGDCTIVG